MEGKGDEREEGGGRMREGEAGRGREEERGKAETKGGRRACVWVRERGTWALAPALLLTSSWTWTCLLASLRSVSWLLSG